MTVLVDIAAPELPGDAPTPRRSHLGACRFEVFGQDELLTATVGHFFRPIAEHCRRTGAYLEEFSVTVRDQNDVLRRLEYALGLAFGFLARRDVDGHCKSGGFAAELDVAKEQSEIGRASC